MVLNVGETAVVAVVSPRRPVIVHRILVRLDEVGGVEEGALFQPYVDECRLHARQDRVDLAEVDVPYCAPKLRPIMKQFD